MHGYFKDAGHLMNYAKKVTRGNNCEFTKEKQDFIEEVTERVLTDATFGQTIREAIIKNPHNFENTLSKSRIKFKPYVPSYKFNLPEKGGVYFIYDDTDFLVYIGKSVNLAGRVPSSFRDAAKYYDVSYVKYLSVPNKADMAILEVYYIGLMKPDKNRESNYKVSPDIEINHGYQFSDKIYPEYIKREELIHDYVLLFLHYGKNRMDKLHLLDERIYKKEWLPQDKVDEVAEKVIERANYYLSQVDNKTKPAIELALKDGGCF